VRPVCPGASSYPVLSNQAFNVTSAILKKARSEPRSDSQGTRGDDLSAFQRVTGLELLEPVDGASLDTDHVAPAVVGGKVGHALGLGLPGVPDDDIVKVVADDAVDLLAGIVGVGDDDGNLGAAGGREDGICLAGNLERAGLRLLGEVVGLVGVGGGIEVKDLDGGDVLWGEESQRRAG
jgi:hypothetical protein